MHIVSGVPGGANVAIDATQWEQVCHLSVLPLGSPTKTRKCNNKQRTYDSLCHIQYLHSPRGDGFGANEREAAARSPDSRVAFSSSASSEFE